MVISFVRIAQMYLTQLVIRLFILIFWQIIYNITYIIANGVDGQLNKIQCDDDTSFS